MEFNRDSEECLFDGALLNNIKFEASQKRLGLDITPTNLGDNYIMRPLMSGDYNRGYIDLLAQLTKVGNITQELYDKRFNAMKACPNTYYITVVENTMTNKLVAAATLALEQKFIHEIALKGRIEEVVVDKECRGKSFGKVLVESLTLLAEDLGCYKISLDCTKDLVSFYTKFQYKDENGRTLTKRIYN